jgi:hypothetical protein
MSKKAILLPGTDVRIIDHPTFGNETGVIKNYCDCTINDEHRTMYTIELKHFVVIELFDSQIIPLDTENFNYIDVHKVSKLQFISK